MRRFPILILSFFLISIAVSSCSDTVTYAEQLKAEKATIKAYLARNGIKVISKVPANNVWEDNVYLLTSDGLYFHLVNPGDVTSKDTVETYNTVVARYYEYTLEEPADTTRRNWSTIDYSDPDSFTYGVSGQSCTGFQEAVSYMKRNNSIAKLIIPSKIGFYSTSTTSVVPYGYYLKIQIQK